MFIRKITGRMMATFGLAAAVSVGAYYTDGYGLLAKPQDPEAVRKLQEDKICSHFGHLVRPLAQEYTKDGEARDFVLQREGAEMCRIGVAPEPGAARAPGADVCQSASRAFRVMSSLLTSDGKGKSVVLFSAKTGASECVVDIVLGEGGGQATVTRRNAPGPALQ